MQITRRRFLQAAAGGTVGAIGYGAYSNVPDVADVQLPLEGLRGPLRIVMISDLHLPRCFVGEDALREATGAFQPHLAVVVGDAVDKAGNEALVDRFASIRTECAKLAVLGNWEYSGRCDIALLQRRYEKAGVRLLVNETAAIDHADFGTARVVGLDDLLQGCPDVDLVHRNGSYHESATVVLAHCPGLFDRLPAMPLVCLSGHTHGGQIAPLGVPLYVPRGAGGYLRGPYEASGGRRLYVTRGLGNNGIPFRVGSRPEIVRLTLTPPAKAT